MNIDAILALSGNFTLEIVNTPKYKHITCLGKKNTPEWKRINYIENRLHIVEWKNLVSEYTKDCVVTSDLAGNNSQLVWIDNTITFEEWHENSLSVWCENIFTNVGTRDLYITPFGSVTDDWYPRSFKNICTSGFYFPLGSPVMELAKKHKAKINKHDNDNYYISEGYFEAEFSTMEKLWNFLMEVPKEFIGK